jgi:putative nucleotidyltransferase with HDIG domain
MMELTALQKRTHENLESRLDRIALLPAVLARLRAIDLDSPSASDHIVELVRSDPPLAFRLMRLANTGLPRNTEVNTIAGAILQVGSHRLASMILTLSVVDVFAPNTRAQRNLWVHSIQTALAARTIAALRPDLNLNRESCYLAGLLHDIGRFVIYDRLPQEIAQLDEAGVSDPRELISDEIRVCGFDHASLGNEICRRWNIPESVTEMVRVHHMYGVAGKQIPPEVAVLVRLVQEADCFSFGLLQSEATSYRSDADRHHAVSSSLRVLSGSERVLPADRLAEEVFHIDREARLAAALVDVAYSDPDHEAPRT